MALLGLAGGWLAGATRRTIGGAVNRLQETRTRTDTLGGVRIGGTGVTVTQQRPMGPGQVPMGQPQQQPTRRGKDYAMTAWERDQFGNWRLKRGYIINKRGKIQKKPSMQVANPVAAVRALRRVKGFEKIARQIIKVSPKFKSKPTFRGARRRSCK